MVFLGYQPQLLLSVVHIGIDPLQIIVGRMDGLSSLLPKHTKPNPPLSKKFYGVFFK